MPKQCVFFFDRYEADGGGQFTLQGTTAASRGTFRFRLGYNVPDFGDLTVTDGSQSIRLSGCRVVRRVITGGSSGRWQEVTIEDRRWRWAYARVWGSYNEIEDNVVILRTKKSARELAELLMEAIGESAYDMSALPSDSYPTVDWSAESATAALEEILSDYGCVLAPLYSGAWVAFRDGSGARPSIDARAMDATPSREPRIVPDRLVFEGGKCLWQHDLYLDAVGVESLSENEPLKFIDDLSYKPAAGWKFEDPRYFQGVTAKKRELAKRCIWRMYRVSTGFQLTVPPGAIANGTNGGKLSTTQSQKVKDYYRVAIAQDWRILPLETRQLSLYKASGEDEAPDAKIVGYFREDKHGWNNNAEPPAAAYDKNKLIDTSADESLVYQGGFQIDPERGLVIFSEPVFLFERQAGKNIARLPAKIRLRTSFGLRDPDSHAELCAQLWIDPPASSRQGIVELVKRPEFSYEIASDKTTNIGDYTTQARLCLEEALATYYPADAISVPYKGFVFDQGLSGAIKAITWAVGERGGGSTQVDYLNERPDLRLSDRDLRARVMQAGFIRDAARQRKQAAIDAKKAKRRPVQ